MASPFTSSKKTTISLLDMVRHWFVAYRAYGEARLLCSNSMLCRYSDELKRRGVEEYVAGGFSSLDLAHKYRIHAENTVFKWVRQYNVHEELTDSRPEKGEYLIVKNNKPRKTTRDECIRIVEYCIANAANYSLAAKEFDCSYGRVYFWVKKHKAQGTKGLYNRRGSQRPKDEFTELEKLQAENRLLKAQAKQQMDIDFLKTRCRRKEVTLKRMLYPNIYITIAGLVEEHPEYSMSRLCRLSHITRTSYYKWKNRQDNENDALNKLVAEKVELIHEEHPDMEYRCIRNTLER